MENLLQNIASVLWIVLGVCFFFGLRKWSKRFSELYDELKEEISAPVVHGRWIEREDPMLDTYYTCSACNEDFYIEQTGDPVKDLFTYTYCPNCGAKMDEKEAVYD